MGYLDGKSYCWLAKRIILFVISFFLQVQQIWMSWVKGKTFGRHNRNWCITIAKSNKAMNLSCNSRHEGVEGGGSMPLNFPRLHPIVHSVERCCGCIFVYIVSPFEAWVPGFNPPFCLLFRMHYMPTFIGNVSFVLSLLLSLEFESPSS